MNKVATIRARHPPRVSYIRHFPADEIGEDTHRHVGHVRVVGIAGPVVALKDLFVIVGHAVRDQHNSLIAAGAASHHTEILEQLERVGQDHGEVGDALGIHLSNAVLQLADVGQVRLDQAVAEARHRLDIEIVG